MATVLFAKDVPDKKRVQIGILTDGDKCVYTVTEATYAAVGSPSVGCDISEADLGTVRFEDEYIRAIKKAMSYLSLSDKSRYELKMKLMRAGFSAETSETALSRICELP